MPLAARLGKAVLRGARLHRVGPNPQAGRPASAPGLSGVFGVDGVFRSRFRAHPVPGWLASHWNGTMTGVELLICLTCKRGMQADADAPRPGAVLMALVDGRAPDGVSVRGVECLSNCDRGCSVALRGTGRWSYVYGDIDPACHVADLLDGAARYAATADGLIPWRERPQILRKGVIARIPPLEAP